MFLCKAYKRGKPSSQRETDNPELPEEFSLASWRQEFRGYSRRAVMLAAERGTFTALRYLSCFRLFFVVGINSVLGQSGQEIDEFTLSGSTNDLPWGFPDKMLTKVKSI